MKEELEDKKQKGNEKETKSRVLTMVSLASELGFSISFPIVGGAFLGQYLDAKFHTSPKLTLSLIFLGLVFSICYIYNIIKKLDKN